MPDDIANSVVAGAYREPPVALDPQASLEAILRAVPDVTGAPDCLWNTFTLTSHFQPIIGTAEQRIVGYEGLLRACDATGRSLSPASVFELANVPSEQLYLDWLSRALHLRNRRNLDAGTDPATDSGLLFINVAPDAAIHDPKFGSVFAALIAHYGIKPSNIVVEIIEHTTVDETRLVDAVRLYKSLGCGVAIDDFGAGASDVRRVWRLKPDIVKLDRSLLVAAARDEHALRVLGNIVNMMHDCGARVVLEGVEDHCEAEAALETSADYLQGYYFGRPGTQRVPDAEAQRLLAGLMPQGEIISLGAVNTPSVDLSDWDRHAEALAAAAMAMDTGAPFSTAAQLLHSLPGTVRCCLLARDGRMLGASTDHHQQATPETPAPCAAVYRLGWQIKSLARQAATDPGVVKLTMPYISTTAPAPFRYGATLCYGFKHHAEIVTLCVDVVF